MTSVPKQEYRQVRHEVEVTGGNGLIWIPYYTLQQKHLVPTGNVYLIPDNGPPDSRDDQFSHNDSRGSWWHRVKTEWRDIETVNPDGSRVTFS